ncbi:helix-turn-helix domain-containing protein [Halalkalibacter alkalisediminis]|uniref:Helix-turn-helix domain-containing protein n=1 Tax=Halalkalibacter alkalisediminis TaxID=935616 RepID=A0ABV6NHG1_9BACI|nr:helix-turn-helix transcriptional regulator [Halalkalibacter alkalisediminis]
MNQRVKSNLKYILDEREISIRKFAEMSGLQYETLRRLYNDTAKQYQRDTIGIICKTLDISIQDLLKLEHVKKDH